MSELIKAYIKKKLGDVNLKIYPKSLEESALRLNDEDIRLFSELINVIYSTSPKFEKKLNSKIDRDFEIKSCIDLIYYMQKNSTMEINFNLSMLGANFSEHIINCKKIYFDDSDLERQTKKIDNTMSEIHEEYYKKMEEEFLKSEKNFYVDRIIEMKSYYAPHRNKLMECKDIKYLSLFIENYALFLSKTEIFIKGNFEIVKTTIGDYFFKALKFCEKIVLSKMIVTNNFQDADSLEICKILYFFNGMINKKFMNDPHFLIYRTLANEETELKNLIAAEENIQILKRLRSYVYAKLKGEVRMDDQKFLTSLNLIKEKCLIDLNLRRKILEENIRTLTQ